ncbi:hypothetical protein D1007_23561 [Hordeum vulgare]|uniref:GRF-type domain-containing protein n=1 Tax=Hordeum vulgare subsp. vulgare TaxID=112509 RepID=A0A8I6Y1H7_HORVV|nr:hypothetical protein D1007_52910 [Hordeum vulgare]KAE8798406.1 hypothetical protein D1007_26266 [Hordeum vulgare]KAE8800851.1 hypothetical protein D1007_23561 [Hordeum vulgare]KAI4999047.1 hypothetical protein ZWY2020_059530 [Hordeum vulgare]
MATSLTSSRSRGSCSSPSIPLGRSSPIPYREGPLDYQPAIECDCGNKAARWISWSNANPGRRYVKCMRDRFPNRCNLFEFVDDPTPPHLAQLIIDLRDAVLSLKKEKQVVCTERDDLEMARIADYAEMEPLRRALRKKDQMLMEKDELLLHKTTELHVQKKRNVMLFVVLMCFISVVLYRVM